MGNSSQQSATRREPRTRRRQQPGRWLRSLIAFDKYTPRAMIIGVLAGGTVFVLLALLISLGAYTYVQVFEVIVPGAYVGDVSLGGLTVNEAAEKLHTIWNVERGIILTDGERTWYAPPSDFGLALDPMATALRAYNVGHGQDILSEMVQLLSSMLNGWEVAPVATIDPTLAQVGLAAWAEAINLPPQDAGIRIENGQVSAVPGVPGYSLDVEATLEVLVTDPGTALADGYLPLVLVPVAPRITDASGAVAEAQQLLSSPLTITAYDAVYDEQMGWTVPPEILATWLGVEYTESGLAVTVNQERLAAHLANLSQTLGADRILDAEKSAEAISTALRSGTPANLTIYHKPTTYTVQQGEMLTSIAWNVGMPYWRILDANPGLEPDTLSVGQTLTIPSKDDLIPLPVIPNKRIKVSIGAQRLWTYENGELLHEFMISTGIDRSPTQPGVFQVQTHEASAYASLWDLTMPNFLGIYESWPGFMNGFHGLPTLSSGVTLWADILGRPASYGCIILDLPDSEWLFDWAENGVVAEITE